jgi:hypothetical protein
MDFVDPPFAPAELGRSVNDLVAAGQRWRRLPDDFLVGVMGREGSTVQHYIREGAAVELSRRNLEALRALDATMQSATDASVQHAQRLESAASASGKQTDTVIELTVQLKKLTVVITWLTVAATLFGGIQAAAVIVRLIRWSRGLP